MTKRKQHQLKGSSLWSLTYAMSSLRNYPIRNMGIALVLAIGISLPTTIFVWSDTGTRLVVHDYFDENTYQLALTLKPNALFDWTRTQELIDAAEAHPYVAYLDRLVSTVGILQNDTLPEWDSYDILGFNYRDGIKDMRTIFVDNNLLGNWSRDFTYEGDFTLSSGEILVSQGFIDYTEEVHGIKLKIGDQIDFDVIAHEQRYSGSNDRNTMNVLPYENFTIVGVYDLIDLGSLIADAFPSVPRKNWDPFQLANDLVLGIRDSIMVLKEDIGKGNVTEISERSYFNSPLLIRTSQDALLAAGAPNVATNLVTFKSQFEEEYPQYSVAGLTGIWELQATIDTYIQSQVLTVIIFPILIMSLMLTIYTSETSVSRRKGEISALRAKGASFNQVFSTFMWESLMLSIIGLGSGIALSFILAPLVGSTVDLFVFDMAAFVRYLSNISIPLVSIVIAAVIAMYLPAAYLLHVAQRIDVSEVGQPMDTSADESAESGSIKRYGFGLGSVLTFLVLLPIIIEPTGFAAVGEILVTTLILFIASYLGSRTMRLVTARVSGGTAFLLGEKALYLSQSLRKRKGQFMPLLVILTLTLTTTTMMLVQTESFKATLQSELAYAIGADMRIESDPKPFSFNETLLRFPGIVDAMPVVETWGQVSDNRFFLEAVDPLRYAQIGKFSEQSFVNNDSFTVLSALDALPNGIVISQYYADLWNKTIGDHLLVYFGGLNTTQVTSFQIVGIALSAPGFGAASTDDLAGASFAAQFGFQAGQGGFALVNIDYLSSITGITEAELFLVDTVCYVDMTPIINSLEEEKNTHVYSVETFNIDEQSSSIRLFLSGIQGLTTIAYLLTAAMGLMAIALFLGSAVLERKSEYAVFRALGGTQRQVISMVFGEFAGTIIAAISISVILGFAFGFALSIMTFGISPFSPVLNEVLAYPFQMMLVTIVAESAVMIAACYIPAKRAGSVNPATALRNL